MFLVLGRLRMADPNSPNYFCKFCETFVRNTKFERNRHENSPRHQGAIQKQLRDTHRQKEREEREKSKVQAELARLNKTVGSTAPVTHKPAADSASLPWKQKAHTFKDDSYRRATAQDLRAQAEQLAQLGVDVPTNSSRRDAEPSGWQVVSVSHSIVEKEEPLDHGSKAEHPDTPSPKREDREEEIASKAVEDIPSLQSNDSGAATVPKRKKRTQEIAEDDLDDLFGAVRKTVKSEVEKPTTGGDDATNEPSHGEPDQPNRAFSRLGGAGAVTFKKRKTAGPVSAALLG